MKKVCFVISPIGEKGSDIRKMADDLYDLIIEPALEKYDFEVIRADKISTVASITSEIIQLVQNSDLCIVDITGHNPNVMYECGRRHETGKPYVMVAREGESLPFDVNTIRTVFYSTKDGRDIRSTVRTIQSIVDKMLSEGMEPTSSGESLSTISDALKRLERKVDSIVTPTVSSGSGIQTSNVRNVLKSLSPTEAFTLAISQRDVGLAEAILPMLQSRLDHDEYIKFVVCRVVALGSATALGILETEIAKLDNITDDEMRKTVIGAYTMGLAIQNREKEALDKLQWFFDAVRSTPAPSRELSVESKAFFLNQHGRLLYGIGEYNKAAEIGAEVISLKPDDPTYYYNQSINLEAIGNIAESLKCVDKYMVLQGTDEPDADHLERAIMMYVHSNRIQDAERGLALLKATNPYKAMLVMEQKDVQKSLKL